MKNIFAIVIPAALIGTLTSVLIMKNATVEPQQGSEYAYSRPYVLLDVMHQFQRYIDKIYFAAQAENQDLTSWYLWKLEQSAIHVSEHKTEPWAKLELGEAALMEDMFIPALKEMYQPVKDGDWDEVNRLYETLIMTCNSCHEILDHGFVNIQVPDHPIYSNQIYTVEG